jgi:hypothetical protein
LKFGRENLFATGSSELNRPKGYGPRPARPPDLGLTPEPLTGHQSPRTTILSPFRSPRISAPPFVAGHRPPSFFPILSRSRGPPAAPTLPPRPPQPLLPSAGLVREETAARSVSVTPSRRSGSRRGSAPSDGGWRRRACCGPSSRPRPSGSPAAPRAPRLPCSAAAPVTLPYSW